MRWIPLVENSTRIAAYSEGRFDQIKAMQEAPKVKRVTCPICKHVHRNLIAGCGVMVGRLECLCVGGPNRAHIAH